MKHFAMTFLIALTVVAPAAHALSIDMGSLTPTLTFPEPQPDAVTKDDTDIGH